MINIVAVRIAATAVVFCVVLPASGQEPLRTAWGTPALQGVWDFRTITPLERPEELKDKEIRFMVRLKQAWGRHVFDS